MQKMKANFRVLTETLHQAKWQMDTEKDTHGHGEREMKWIQWSDERDNGKERHKRVRLIRD